MRIKTILPVLIVFIVLSSLASAELLRDSDVKVECTDCRGAGVNTYRCDDKECTFTFSVEGKLEELPNQDAYTKFDKKAKDLKACFTDGTIGNVVYKNERWHQQGDDIDCSIGCREKEPGKAECLLFANEDYEYSSATAFSCRKDPNIQLVKKGTKAQCKTTQMKIPNPHQATYKKAYAGKESEILWTCYTNGEKGLIEYKDENWYAHPDKEQCPYGCYEKELGKAECMFDDKHYEVHEQHYGCTEGYKADIIEGPPKKVACKVAKEVGKYTKIGTLKLKNAEVKLDSNTAYPKSIKALKDSTDKQNINGYETDMAKNDMISFKALTLNRFTLDIYDKRPKLSSGKMKPVSVCGQSFSAVAGDIGKFKSSFDIQLIQKENSETPECEITYYKIFNVVDEKDKNARYDYKCGIIQYHAVGQGINGINCLPKIKYSSDEKRKEESKLYCDDKDIGCKQTFFWFDIDSERFKVPLAITIRGRPTEYATRVDFQQIVAKPEKNPDPKVSTYNAKELTAKNFAISRVSYSPIPKGTNKPTVKFVEQTPFMAVPNGINVDFYGTFRNLVRVSYLPEFFKNPPQGVSFKGYTFRFNNNFQGPEVVYPTGLNIGRWELKDNERIGATYHIGLKPTVKMKGKRKVVQTKDKRKWVVPELMLIEMRVKGDYLTAPKKKRDPKKQVTTKVCKDHKVQTVASTQTLWQFAAGLLGYGNYKFKVNDPKSYRVQRLMTEIIRLNQKPGTTLYGKVYTKKAGKVTASDWQPNKCLKYSCKGTVSVANTDGKTYDRVWAHSGSQNVQKGDKVKIPCDSVITATKGKNAKVKVGGKKKIKTARTRRGRYTRRSSFVPKTDFRCSKLGGECMTFKSKRLKSQIKECQEEEGIFTPDDDYTVAKGLCKGGTNRRCCLDKDKAKELRWINTELKCNIPPFKDLVGKKGCRKDDGVMIKYICRKNSIHGKIVAICEKGCNAENTGCKAVKSSKTVTKIPTETVRPSFLGTVFRTVGRWVGDAITF